MMQVDRTRCAGCGECLEACPVGAISLADAKAVIDIGTCLSCGACMVACPQGAIIEASLPVPARPVVIRPEKMDPIIPVQVLEPEGRFAWAWPVLSFMGQEILPRLADTLVAALDRHVQRAAVAPTGFNLLTSSQQNGRGRQLRRRQRGRKV